MIQPVIQNGWQYNVKKLFGLIDQDVGAKNGTGVTVTETSGAFKKTVLNFEDVSIAMVNATTAGSHGSLKIYDFPAGSLAFIGATSNLTVARVGTNITATAAVVGSVGTVTVVNDNATLTTTEANLLPSTAATLTDGAGTLKGESLTAGIAIFDDGVGTPKDAFLNFAVPDAGTAEADDALLINGTVTLVWTNLGDN